MNGVTLTLHDVAFLGSLRDSCAIYIGSRGGGDTFDCYEVQDPITVQLRAGNRFSGAWAVRLNYLLVQAIETFESYPVQDPLQQALNGPGAWAGAWVTREPYVPYPRYDTFESYAVTGTVYSNSLNSTPGWSGGWVVNAKVATGSGEDTFETYQTGFFGTLVSPTPQLGLTQLTDWSVDNVIDLVGNGVEDAFPGNGLYLRFPSQFDAVEYTAGTVIAAGTYSWLFDIAGYTSLSDRFTCGITLSVGGVPVVTSGQAVVTDGAINQRTVPFITAGGTVVMRFERDNVSPQDGYLFSTSIVPSTGTVPVFYEDWDGQNALVGIGAGGRGWADIWAIPVTTPVFTPASGAAPLQVVITCPSYASADIYYSANGTTPTTASQHYTGTITVPSAGTYKAKAFLPAMRSSATGTAFYT